MNKFFTSLILPGTTRIFSIIVAVVVFIIDIIFNFIDSNLLNNQILHLVFQLMVVSNLLIAATLQSIDTDEREKTIRANINRIMLPVILMFLSGVSFILAIFQSFSISTIIILYIIEFGLIVYLLLYRYAMNNSPRWLLHERKLKNSERLGLVLAPLFTLPIVFFFFFGYFVGKYLAQIL